MVKIAEIEGTRDAFVMACNEIARPKHCKLLNTVDGLFMLETSKFDDEVYAKKITDEIIFLVNEDVLEDPDLLKNGNLYQQNNYGSLNKHFTSRIFGIMIPYNYYSIMTAKGIIIQYNLLHSFCVEDDEENERLFDYISDKLNYYACWISDKIPEIDTIIKRGFKLKLIGKRITKVLKEDGDSQALDSKESSQKLTLIRASQSFHTYEDIVLAWERANLRIFPCLEDDNTTDEYFDSMTWSTGVDIPIRILDKGYNEYLYIPLSCLMKSPKMAVIALEDFYKDMQNE